MTNTKNQWRHDGADRHESWWFGPAGCDVDQALGSVHPEWSETRAHGVGKPDRWVARGKDGTRLDHAPTRREATAIVERYIAERNKCHTCGGNDAAHKASRCRAIFVPYSGIA